jgi:hypothetical protein
MGRLSFGYWIVTACENIFLRVRAMPWNISMKVNLFIISLTVTLRSL